MEKAPPEHSNLNLLLYFSVVSICDILNSLWRMSSSKLVISGHETKYQPIADILRAGL